MPSLHYDLPFIECLLLMHRLGHSQTASGYGTKLTSRWKVRVEGRLRRVYITQWANAGSLWIIVGGRRVSVSRTN